MLVLTLLVMLSAIKYMMTSESDSYSKARRKILDEGKSAFFGHQVTLSGPELEVDELLRAAKNSELHAGYKNSSEFLPSLHFFRSKERIEKSGVFQIIKQIPKGASLHTHLTAGVSVDFIIENFTYRDDLYGGYVNNVFKLKFMRDPSQDGRSSHWTLIKDLRSRQTPEAFDWWLKTQLILNVDDPEIAYPNAEAVWAKFKKTFTTVYDVLSYRPVFEEYIYRLLEELYDDNIMYTELKGTIMQLYELDCTYNNRQFFEIFIQAVDNFKKDYPHFLGVRYIHSIYRGVDREVLQAGLDEITEMKTLFPDFIAGFDFVGYEEDGNSLWHYSPVLLQARKDLKLFFHAGETNWFGHTDLNLIDAVMLNSSRIGHGFALTKHPQILKLAKERNIPLEICPISNQVLKLIEDPRNHPAAVLMALDYPIVLCNDDPSAWNATGLSYDWYVAFMAMTPKDGGLEILKQFAVNSIAYSAMGEKEKDLALEEWKKQWGEFLNDVLKEHAQTTK